MRRFKALPSGRFGRALSIAWQQVIGLRIIAVPPRPGKSFRSQHCRIRLRRPGDAGGVLSGRAPRKPFSLLSLESHTLIRSQGLQFGSLTNITSVGPRASPIPFPPSHVYRSRVTNRARKVHRRTLIFAPCPSHSHARRRLPPSLTLPTAEKVRDGGKRLRA